MYRHRVLVLLFLLLGSGQAAAARRIALVIGNDVYPTLSTEQQLHNAVRDAELMKTTLTDLGFTVSLGENLGRSDMIDKISDFGASLEADDVALFFYAGHGVALNGQNYILPTDIPLPRSTARNEEQRLADHAVSENDIHERVTVAKVAVVVLDSCRDNPLASTTGRSIGTGRGLVRPTETRGMLSIYAAGVGQQALDRLDETDTNPNSVFTRVFAEKLKLRGMGLRDIAFATQQEVASLAEKAGQTQFPGVYSQVVGDVYLNGAAPVSVGPTTPVSVGPTPPPPPPPHESAEEAQRRFDSIFAQFGKRPGQSTPAPSGNADRRKMAAIDPTAPDVGARTVIRGAFGLDLEDLSPAVRRKFGVADNAEGVAVTNVDPAWPHTSFPLKIGDVVKEVSMVPVKSPAELVAKLDGLKKDGKKSALLRVQNTDGTRFIAFPLSR